MLYRITVMDGGALKLLTKLFGLLQVKDVTRLSLPSNMKSSTSLEAGDAASTFEWRRQYLLCKRTG